MDCVYQSVAFITGSTVQQIQQDYVAFFNNRNAAAGIAPLWNIDYDMAGVGGVPYRLANDFLAQYNISSGYTNSAPYGTSGSSGAGIILIPGHAYNITGMANAFTYNTYDAQSGQTGTISIGDPRILGVYSGNN